MKYIIKTYTDWEGEENYYKMESLDYQQVEETAYNVAEENFYSYGGCTQIAENMGFNIEEMTGENWEKVYEEICENEPFGALIEDYNEELHGDWDDYEYLS